MHPDVLRRTFTQIWMKNAVFHDTASSIPCYRGKACHVPCGGHAAVLAAIFILAITAPTVATAMPQFIGDIDWLTTWNRIFDSFPLTHTTAAWCRENWPMSKTGRR